LTIKRCCALASLVIGIDSVIGVTCETFGYFGLITIFVMAVRFLCYYTIKMVDLEEEVKIGSQKATLFLNEVPAK